FLDSYDPDFICNHSDHQGRYAFNQQPSIGLFNLSCLAQAFLPLLAEDAEDAVNQAKDLLSKYEPQFVHDYAKLSRQKLGLQKELKQDQELHATLLKLLDSNNVDYTRFFRALSGFSSDKDAINHGLRDMFINRDAFDHWAQQYRKRLLAEGNDDSARKLTMNQVNPKYILRNYLAENAIRKATDEKDYTEIDRLIQVLSNPFDEQPQFESYAAEPPDWAQHIEVSCSS
ncbi:protein adenylyltransferase SelO family protein, partial [Kaarinaea lacus]